MCGNSSQAQAESWLMFDYVRNMTRLIGENLSRNVYAIQKIKNYII